MPRIPSIRVGQRLIAWDGTPGFVALNSHGKSVYGPGEAFRVEWLDTDMKAVEDSQYLTLEALEAEGIRRGKGLMPWAK